METTKGPVKVAIAHVMVAVRRQDRRRSGGPSAARHGEDQPTAGAIVPLTCSALRRPQPRAPGGSRAPPVRRGSHPMGQTTLTTAKAWHPDQTATSPQTLIPTALI